jgi:predicted nucleic acid-binding Zn ribbon protein
MTPEERTAFEKRRRQRNWAMLFVLIGLVVLFYFISVARLLRG